MARSKGLGNIQKRGKFYHVFYTVNGKKTSKSLRVSTKREAEKEARKLMLEAVKIEDKSDIRYFTGKAKKMIKQNSFTLLQIWENFNKNYLAEKNILTSTKNRYKYRLDVFLDWFKENYSEIKRPNQITKEHIRDFLLFLKNEKMSTKTYKDSVFNLKKIFDVIIESSGLEFNPFDGIEMRNENETVQKETITDKQVQALFEAIENIKLNNKEEYKLLFLIGTYTGARLKDCCLMCWSNVDFERNNIEYIPYKTSKQSGKKAIVPILDELKSLMIATSKIQSSKYILPSIARLYNKNRKYIVQVNNKIFKHAGLKDIEAELEKQTGKLKPCLYGFHSFRYYFITLCAKKNIPIKIVMDAVGHSKELMNLYYQRFNNEDRQKAFGLTGNELYRAKKRKVIDLLDHASELVLNDILEILENK